MNRRQVAFAFAAPFVVGVALLGACSSDDAGDETSSTTATPGADGSTTTPPPGADAAAVDSAPPTDDAAIASACVPVPDGGAQCNTLTNIGTSVSVVVTGTAMPTGTGGPIADGRYVLTDFKSYTGSPLTVGSLKQTLEICGGIAQLVGDDNGKPTYHKTFSLEPVGTAPNDAPICTTQVPNAEINSSSYTATPTSLTFFSTTYLISVTYTLQ